MSLVPQIGMAELLVIGIIALIVIGPKDLPRLMYRVGKIFKSIRGMADEFKASFDQMAREAEIEEMRKEIDALKKANPAKDMKDALDDVQSASNAPRKSYGPPPVAAKPAVPVAPDPEPAPEPEQSDAKNE